VLSLKKSIKNRQAVLRWQKTPEGRKAHNEANARYKKTEKGKTASRKYGARYRQTLKEKISRARGENARALRDAVKISMRDLKYRHSNYGYPDWPDELIEEKKVGDGLRASQIKRFDVMGREGKVVKICLRLTFNKQIMFSNYRKFIKFFIHPNCLKRLECLMETDR
jgi:hypothetical protein